MSKIRKFAGFIVAVLVFSSISPNTYAQNYYVENENTFFGGPVLGLNFSQVDGDNYAGYHKIGMTVGGVVYTRFSDMFAASMEILYSQRGSRSNGPKTSNNRRYEITKYGIELSYAEIPIMINIFDKRKSHVGIGFSYNQLVSSKETVVTTNQKFNDTAAQFFDKFPFRKSDVNLVLGGDLRLYKGLYLGVKFQYSLFPVRKDINQEFGRAEQYNNCYSLRLVYLFGQKYNASNN